MEVQSVETGGKAAAFRTPHLDGSRRSLPALLFSTLLSTLSFLLSAQPWGGGGGPGHGRGRVKQKREGEAEEGG
jgi:hypothetical protein